MLKKKKTWSLCSLILDATSSLTHPQQDTNPASLDTLISLSPPFFLLFVHFPHLSITEASGPWLSLLNSVIIPDNIQIYMDDLTNALETQFFISTFSDLHLHSFSDLGIDICNFSPQLSYFLTTTSYASLPTLIPISYYILIFKTFSPPSLSF